MSYQAQYHSFFFLQILRNCLKFFKNGNETKSHATIFKQLVCASYHLFYSPDSASTGMGGSDEHKPTSMSDQKVVEERTNMLICHFLFALVWSVGATVDGNSREK